MAGYLDVIDIVHVDEFGFVLRTDFNGTGLVFFMAAEKFLHHREEPRPRNGFKKIINRVDLISRQGKLGHDGDEDQGDPRIEFA